MAYRTPQHVQEQKDAKRKHILDKALEVFANKGFHVTSIQDICNTAGVSVGSIYFYFPNKDSIYEAVYDEIMANLFKKMEDSVIDEHSLKNMIEKSIRTIVAFMTATPHVALFFRNNSDVSTVKQRRDDIFKLGAMRFKQILDEWIRKGELEPIHTEMAVIACTGSLYHLIRYWNISGEKLDIEEMTGFLIQYNLRGLGIERS